MDLESSLELLQRAKRGEADALEQLMARYLVPLRRWARGRLPQWARDMSDTQDIVQDAIVQTLGQLARFEPRGPGALHWYLRQAVTNRIRDELRRAHRRPRANALDDDFPSASASPLAMAIGKEALDTYEAALAALREDEREMVVAHTELGMDYDEIAAAFDKPSRDAARMAVRRGLYKLADAMKSRHASVS